MPLVESLLLANSGVALGDPGSEAGMTVFTASRSL